MRLEQIFCFSIADDRGEPFLISSIIWEVVFLSEKWFFMSLSDCVTGRPLPKLIERFSKKRACFFKEKVFLLKRESFLNDFVSVIFLWERRAIP